MSLTLGEGVLTKKVTKFDMGGGIEAKCDVTFSKSYILRFKIHIDLKLVATIS